MCKSEVFLSELINNIKNFGKVSVGELFTELSKTKAAINSITFYTFDSELVADTKRIEYERLISIESFVEILLIKKLEDSNYNNPSEIFSHFTLNTLYRKFDYFFDKGVLIKNDSLLGYLSKWLEDESMPYLAEHFTLNELDQLYEACECSFPITKWMDEIF